MVQCSGYARLPHRMHRLARAPMMPTATAPPVAVDGAPGGMAWAMSAVTSRPRPDEASRLPDGRSTRSRVPPEAEGSGLVTVVGWSLVSWVMMACTSVYGCGLIACGRAGVEGR